MNQYRKSDDPQYSSHPGLRPGSSLSGAALIILWMLLFSGGSAWGQVAGPGPRSTWVALPILYHAPETNWAFGAGLSYTFHLDTVGRSPSTIQFGGVYTLKKQILSSAVFNLYYPEKKWQMSGELGYYDYVYQYWGTGNNSPSTARETYQMRFPRFRISPKLIFRDYWRLGLAADINYYYDISVQSGGILDQHQNTGVQGGWVNGIGPILQYDGREHTLFPVNGFYGSAKILYYGNVWGSGYEFLSGDFDFRYYQNLSQGMVWASQGLATFRSGSEIPFYHLSLLGGPTMLRGFHHGRYRDRHLWALQTELRMPVWRRILVVPFVAAGDVFDFENSRSHIKVAGGLGLRYIVNHENRVNIRFDAAYGRRFQFYLSILEAF